MCNCHAHKTGITEGQNWMAAVAEHNLHVSYDLGVSLYRPTALWILGEMATASIFSAASKWLQMGHSTGELPAPRAAVSRSPSTDLDAATPITVSTTRLQLWQGVWASVFLCKLGTNQQWKRLFRKGGGFCFVCFFPLWLYLLSEETRCWALQQ